MTPASAVPPLLASLPGRVEPAAVEGLAASFAFDLAPAGDAEGGAATVRVADGRVAVEAGAAPDADVRVAARADDWDAIVAGDLDLQLAHRTGRLVVEGDMALAQRVRALLGF